MPNKGDVSNYTGVFRLASPSDPNRKVIKRNRQVVSCVPCRNRKLKCDRQQPCASCVRRHDENGCKFHAGLGDGGNGSATSPGHASPLPKRQMQTKLAMLERLVEGIMSQGQPDETISSELRSRETSRSGASPPCDPAPSIARKPAAGGHLSRDDNEVRFVGATNYRSVLECIRDLQGCVDDIDRPALPTSTSSRQQDRAKANDHLFVPEKSITIQEVMGHLPARAECDSILTFYFQQTYMVPLCVHTGQFQRAYERFWLTPNTTSLLWISLLFSLLSTSVFQQTSKTLRKDDESSTSATDAGKRIADFSSMAYQCLLAGDYLLGKPYSVEATLIFGMHLVLQKRDTESICWHTIGTAVRLAQRMGYHRDASHLVRNSNDSAISPFEGEMRRRVWAYLEYFDVVYSFQHGVPPIIHGDMVDTQIPSNLSDEEFNEDVMALPQARSTLEFTPILVLTFGARQVKLLRRVIQQALSVNPPSYGDVRILDNELRSLHEDVPPSLRYRPVRESGFADVPDVIMRRMLCEIMYLKCICVLHRRYLTYEGIIYEGSRLACREASMRLLQLQAEFDEHSGEGGRLYEKRYMFTNPTGYHDFLLAAMCICLDLINETNNSNSKEHENKVKALDRARTIWSKTANRSREAAHASDVLESILSRIDRAERHPPSASLPPTDGQERLAESVAANVSASEKFRDDLPRSTGNSEASLIQPNRSSVNAGTAPAKAPRKSYSIEWSFEWLDHIGKRKDHTLNGALENVLTDGVDWDHIDSLLLGREHTTGTNAMLAPRAEDSLTDREASREGWPYPQYDTEQTGAEDSSNFRSWARTGCTLAGFGPSSSGPHFL